MLLLTWITITQMIQNYKLITLKQLIMVNHTCCASLSRYDEDIDQQINYVESPVKNTDGSLLMVSDP